MNKYLFNKTIYIVSDELKKEMLTHIRENKLLLDVHFFSMNEFIKRCYFDYDYSAIYHLSKKYNMSFTNSSSFINQFKYLMYSNEINDNKYLKLKKMKDYLDTNNLLQYDYKFIDYLKNYNIFTDLDISSPFINRINELLNNKIQVIKNDVKENINIYEYQDSENEIENLANKIGKLLANGIHPNKIHVLNYSSDYSSYIKKIFTLYNIPFNLKNDTYMYDLQYVKDIFNNYLLTNEFDFNDSYIDINNKFIECINAVSFIVDLNDRQEFLLYLLKQTKIKEKQYSNIINFDNNIGYLIDNHYYFFIGLNNKIFPSYKKDEDYFSDKNKLDMGYFTSYNSNKVMKIFYIEKLKANATLNISYRNSDYFNKYSPSDITNLVASSIIKNQREENKYSQEYNKLKFARELDTYYKYNSESEELKFLVDILNKDEYKSYDNSYKAINETHYHENTLNNSINISASSLEKFNECNFKYYINSILNERDSSFSTYLGSLFHYILEDIYNDNFDFDKRLKDFSSDYELTKLENILLENTLKDFKDKINIILEQYKKTNFKEVKQELHISIYKKAKLSIKIHGFIDKLMLNEENKGYIVDYKTGNKKLTLTYLDNGLEIQLPFYFYLINKSKEYADIFLVGCYLQLLNFKIQSISQVKKEMQLEGYTYDEEEIVSLIDSNYNNDSYIKGIKPNKNGLGTHAKLFDNSLINEIIEKMDSSINNMISSIEQVKFEINPKILKDNTTTCKYCKFKDICFHKYSNYIDLREGGDEDGMDE